MKLKCINDFSGDFRYITVGKDYDFIREKETIKYVIDGVKHTEKRYVIKNDDNTEWDYPINCFEVVGE